MEPIVINFGEIEKFEALPAGNYPIIVEAVTVKTAQESGNPYLSWDLKISTGPSAGRHLFFMTSLTPQSLWRLKAIFESLGVFSKSGTQSLAIVPDPSTGLVLQPQLVGLPGIAVTRQEMYQGRMTNRVDDILPITASAPSIAPTGQAPAGPFANPAPKPATQLPLGLK